MRRTVTETPQRPLGSLATACGRGGIVAIIALLGWTTAAADVSVLAPRPGATLRAGETVEVRWTALAADVEEFELLLSLDGGRSFPVRLTPQLDPKTQSLPWVVPNLPCQAARIMVRFGRAGREIETPPSGAFRIEAILDRHPAWLREEGGELWLSAITTRLGPEIDRAPRRLRRPTARPSHVIPAVPTHHARGLAAVEERLAAPLAARNADVLRRRHGDCGRRPTFFPRRE